MQTIWRNKLREKFKNLRKRRKRPSDKKDPAEHKQSLSVLKEEIRKKKKIKNIKQLLMTTYTEWRRWIVEEGPSVQDVVRQYPPLRIQRWVCFRV